MARNGANGRSGAPAGDCDPAEMTSALPTAPGTRELPRGRWTPRVTARVAPRFMATGSLAAGAGTGLAVDFASAGTGQTLAVAAIAKRAGAGLGALNIRRRVEVCIPVIALASSS